MKRSILLFGLVALVSCSKEIQVQQVLLGHYKIDRNVVETTNGVFVQIHADKDPMEWEITMDAIHWYRLLNGKMSEYGMTQISRDASNNITKVGCRQVVEQNDSAITWIQIANGQDGPWYISYIMSK